eukprot:XP_017173230.1 PREDICTED: LOW QUALITY PROTEIN: SH2 domain-containing protein 3A [Mus musculus]
MPPVQHHQETEALLQQDGDFLVHDSESREVISYHWRGKTLHFEVFQVALHPRPGRHQALFPLKDERFASMFGLVQSYMTCRCPLSQATGAVVSKPVSHQRPLMLSLSEDVLTDSRAAARPFRYSVWRVLLSYFRQGLTGPRMDSKQGELQSDSRSVPFRKRKASGLRLIPSPSAELPSLYTTLFLLVFEAPPAFGSALHAADSEPTLLKGLPHLGTMTDSLRVSDGQLHAKAPSKPLWLCPMPVPSPDPTLPTVPCKPVECACWRVKKPLGGWTKVAHDAPLFRRAAAQRLQATPPGHLTLPTGSRPNPALWETLTTNFLYCLLWGNKGVQAARADRIQKFYHILSHQLRTSWLRAHPPSLLYWRDPKDTASSYSRGYKLNLVPTSITPGKRKVDMPVLEHGDHKHG